VSCSGFTNPGIKPRKPLIILIEGLFLEAMKIIKGFPKGTAVTKYFWHSRG
jgi:hypothetical protein